MKHRLAALALLTACDSTPDAPPAPAAEAPVPAPRISLEKSEPEPPPGPAVELPPKRDLQPPAAPATYEDGARSIRGLREDPALPGDEGTEVLVRAYVQEIYAPPPCPPRETCPRPRPAHAWLADAPSVAGKRHAMMVTGYEFAIRPFEERMWRDQPNIVFQIGKAYTIKARFTLTADSGATDPRGLLDFIAYKDEGGAWVYPPGSPAHPLVLAQQAEQTARLKALVEKGGRKR